MEHLVNCAVQNKAARLNQMARLAIRSAWAASCVTTLEIAGRDELRLVLPPDSGRDETRPYQPEFCADFFLAEMERIAMFENPKGSK
jgi:hypothetical protein